MATSSPYNLHDHSGWLWLAPFSAVFILSLFAAVMMMLYPHMFR